MISAEKSFGKSPVISSAVIRHFFRYQDQFFYEVVMEHEHWSEDVTVSRAELCCHSESMNLRLFFPTIPNQARLSL